jgi:phage terminase small subunit
MPRPAKKLELCAKHYTKAEKEAKKELEIKLGLTDLDKIKPPEFVRGDAIAFKYWKQHIKEYKDAAANKIEVLSSSDIGMLALYCKTYADYERLLKAYQTIDNIAYDSEKLDSYIEESDEFNFKVKQQLRSMIAVDGLFRIETAINKKMDMLIKMQDRLFLNPLARVRNVPRKEAEKKTNPLEEKYNI